MKSTGAQSSNELLWCDQMIGYKFNGPNNGHQGYIRKFIATTLVNNTANKLDWYLIYTIPSMTSQAIK